MRRILLAASALGLLANVASAGGINLSWDDCGVHGSVSKNFACDVNTGVDVFYGSAVAPAPVTELVTMEATMDLLANQATLPPWWNFDPALEIPFSTGCRSGPLPALTASFDFVSGPFSCADPWGGQASGGSNYQSSQSSFGFLPNRARLRTICAVPFNISLDNVTEYYMFRVTISNAKTVGVGACGGCDVGVCLVLQSVELVQQPPAPDYILSNPLHSQYIVWQNGAGVHGGCPEATPTRTTTWGAVKSLYR